MFYKVKSVKPMGNYKLEVCFENGEKKNYDVGALFEKYEDFRTLASVTGLFEQVRVDAGGYAVCWNDDLDIACNELWYNGVVI